MSLSTFNSLISDFEKDAKEIGREASVEELKLYVDAIKTSAVEEGKMYKIQNPENPQNDTITVQKIENGVAYGMTSDGQAEFKKEDLDKQQSEGKIVEQQNVSASQKTGKYKGKLVYTIQEGDVGKRFLKDDNAKVWSLSDSIGYVQQQDVGKQLIDNGGVLSMESASQRDMRVERGEIAPRITDADIKEYTDKLADKSSDEKKKILFEWVKTKHIDLATFKALLSYIGEGQGVKAEKKVGNGNDLRKALEDLIHELTKGGKFRGNPYTNDAVQAAMQALSTYIGDSNDIGDSEKKEATVEKNPIKIIDTFLQEWEQEGKFAETDVEKAKADGAIAALNEVKRELYLVNTKFGEKKEATGEANQEYDKEFFDKVVDQLYDAGFEARHKEFDKYQGVYIRVSNIDKFWIEDVYYTGVKSKEDKAKPYTNAVLWNPDGEKESAMRGDYFNRKKDYVFEDYTLVLTKADGTKEEIENPIVSQLPDIGDVQLTTKYEKGSETEVYIFSPENDPDAKIGVEKNPDGTVDASELIEYCKDKQAEKKEGSKKQASYPKESALITRELVDEFCSDLEAVGREAGIEDFEFTEVGALSSYGEVIATYSDNTKAIDIECTFTQERGWEPTHAFVYLNDEKGVTEACIESEGVKIGGLQELKAFLLKEGHYDVGVLIETQEQLDALEEVPEDGKLWEIHGKNLRLNKNIKVYGSLHAEDIEGGSGVIEAFGTSHVEVYSDVNVEAHDKSYVEAFGYSNVKAFDNSNVFVYDNARVDVYDNARAHASDQASINKKQRTT